MKSVSKMCICVGLLAFAGQAAAAPTSIVFGSLGYSDNTGLEGLMLGPATFTSETGRLYYEANYGGGLSANLPETADILVNFAQPVCNVGATAGDGGGDFDAFSLYLFDKDANPLGRFDSPQFGGTAEPEWYTLNTSVGNVSRVVFDPGNAGGLPGNLLAQGGIVLTMLSYEICGGDPEPPDCVIPAPGALMLCALGTTVVTWLRSRRML